MATQTITVAVAALDSNTLSTKRWEWASGLDLDAFLEPAGTTRTLFRFLARNDRGPDNIELRLFVDANSDGADLAEAWEADPAGLTFTQGANSITIPGPAHTSNAAADDTERYFWSPPSDQAQDVREFFFLHLNTGADWTIAFRVSPVAVQLRGADAGATTASQIAVSTSNPVKTVQLRGADAGSTTASQIAVSTSNPVKTVELTGADAGATSARQVRATVIAPPIATPHAIVTHKTNRVDLLARQELGSDSDVNRRSIIRWNAARFAGRPTFWLEIGEVIFTAPPEPMP